MAYIRIRNDNNDVLIGDEYVGYCVASSGSLTMPQPDPGIGSARQLSISYTSTSAYQPTLAIECEYLTSVFSYSKVGDVHTWIVSGERAANAAYSVRWWVFDVPDRLPGTGLVVLRNAKGEVTFDSDGRYMRVLDFKQIRTDSSNTPGSSNYNTNRRLAVVHCCTASDFQSTATPSGSPNIWIIITLVALHGYRVNNGAVSWETYAHSSTRTQIQSSTVPPQGSRRNVYSAAMIVDVTGY